MIQELLVPYTQEEAKTLAEALVASGIGTIGGPETSIRMMRFAAALQAMEQEHPKLEPAMRTIIKQLRQRVSDVALVNGMMCGAVIDRLEKFVNAPEGQASPL